MLIIVTDANGNRLPEQVVTLTADNNATVTTGSDGSVRIPLTSTTAGNRNVTATLNGSSQTVATRFVANVRTASIKASDMTILKDNSLSDGSSQNTLQVIVKDAWNNTLAGVDVAFTASNGATPLPAMGTTDSQGITRVSVTSLKSGIIDVTANINGNHQTQGVTFTAANIPQIVEVQDTAGSLTGRLNSGQVTDDTTPTLSGTADPNATLRLFSDGNQVGSGVADSDGQWSLKVSSAISGEGNHALTATAALTPKSEQSPLSDVFILNLDTIAETPTILSVVDTNGRVKNGGNTNGDQVVVSGTAEIGSTVKLYAIRSADRVHALLGSVTADSEGHWQILVTDIRIFQKTADYSFQASMTDIAGNSSDEASCIPYVINFIIWPAPSGSVVFTPTIAEQQLLAMMCRDC